MTRDEALKAMRAGKIVAHRDCYLYRLSPEDSKTIEYRHCESHGWIDHTDFSSGLLNAAHDDGWSIISTKVKKVVTRWVNVYSGSNLANDGLCVILYETEESARNSAFCSSKHDQLAVAVPFQITVEVEE